MPLFRVTEKGLEEIERTDFATAQIRERQDLQRFLRDQIDAVDRDPYVLSEEFSRWEEGSRRIDLLALDRDANLVVIELKRSDHGGHMELQAIRYAAMIANVTFDQAVRAHKEYITSRSFDWDAEQHILEFLGWDEANEEAFGSSVRILLVSADFSRELTTSVLWLNENGLDIRCIRLRPYQLDSALMLQVEQVLPLPEAQEYMVGVREKQRREATTSTKDLTRFDVEIDGNLFTRLAKRQAIVRVAHRLCASGVSPYTLAESSGRAFNTIWRHADGDLDADELFTALEQQADDGGPAFDPRRWFVDNDLLIQSDGKTWAFTKMWGTKTEEIMQRWLSEHPNSGITVQRSD